ncbi:type VII secretion-associated protein [Mycobacterium sp. 852002-51057_SCH5723018]|uniref:type VII secretion-associated protein n=1 Tax=Mycobacterium sp. 852002-51057_SCH5723018 TaxID=1834094 RepID=UPI0007FFBCE3|nr:type VII secretion-associated protein [Mycobacterium sp. 852002-51057_SCH5723018]OBG22375.1 type VII secretion-associated protein [Mycobacterium sp. 852002-51057_SCH5723018]
MNPTPGPHHAIIEAGPGTIRRLCCGTTQHRVDDDASEIATEALGAIDDRVALLAGRPVTVDSAWRAALRSLDCAHHDGLVLVYPSWWSSTRIGVVTTAAKRVADDVLARPRSWLLAQASDGHCDTTVVVEIAERLVAINGAELVAVSRAGEPLSVAQEAATVIADMTRGSMAGVVIDVPGTVAGAPALGAAITAALRDGGRPVAEIDDARLCRLAQSALTARAEPPEPRSTARAGGVRSRARMVTWLAGVAVVVTGSFLALPTVVAQGHRPIPPPVQVQPAPTTFLVEGRVTVTVPADWPTQRVVTGPGSARVQVTSPSDPEVALHVTQSPVAGETLSGTAERLKHAIDTEAAGVFVDFNPSGLTAGRPAVTYREVRAHHHVRWTVLLDGPVRISIGCQSRSGDEEAVRTACEQAVRSAHAIG